MRISDWSSDVCSSDLDALAAQAGAPLRKRLAGFTVDDPGIVLLGRETIFRDGRQVGWLTSGGYGYTVGKNIGFGYVRDAEGVSTDRSEEGRVGKACVSSGNSRGAAY